MAAICKPQADVEDAVPEGEEERHGTLLAEADAWGKDVDFAGLERRLAALGRPHARLRRISPEIISCSRRTDVPAHYASGLVKILRRGEVLVVIRGNYSLVSLSPETVKAWVWWSKNYAPWIEAFRDNPALFTRYPAHLFHFTITGLGDLETGQPPLEERLAQIGFLAGLGKVVVRFDPITRYQDETGQVRSNSALIPDFIPLFKAAGAHEIEFKFCVPYAGTLKRMAGRGHPLLNWPPGRKQQIVRGLMAACKEAGITLRACCPDPDEMVEGLEVGACVDGEAINALLGPARNPVGLRKDKGQRAKCKCVESKDIGSYRMKCPHDCDYCYAQPGAANEAFR